MNFIPAIQPPASGHSTALLFLFNEEGLLALDSGSIPSVDNTSHCLKNSIFLGMLGDFPCYVARSKASSNHPSIYDDENLRLQFGLLPDEHYALAGFASQILTWRENHQFCSKCGAKAEPSETDRTMVCTSCGFMNYPRISPCIIVAVTKGEQLLMARSHHFPEGLYSVVAGFLEPGESLEECVAREVKEETGLDVTNIQYFANQPWPFPHSLMVGFKADWAGGEIKIDPKEIEDAGWYTADNMPEKIPSESTIARRLIDDYLNSF